MDLPLGRNPLTLTTTLTFPPGFKLLEGAIATFTGVFERSDGLEADEWVGVVDRGSCVMVLAGGTMTAPWSKSCIHSSMTEE